jgi:hypothetical protein
MFPHCTEITPSVVCRFTKLGESAANKQPSAGIVGSMPLRIEKPMSVIETGEV